MTVAVERFPDRLSASQAAAEKLTLALQETAGSVEKRALVVSGGTTPGDCFRCLSESSLDWENISIVPSDERWVPPSHPQSNEKLVRELLMTNAAAQAGFVPLYQKEVEPDDAIGALGLRLQPVIDGLSCSLLGMGTDGHFASLFPDYDDLETALNPNNPDLCVSVHTQGSPYVRISLTLTAILHSEVILLLIFGDEKLQVLEAAMADGKAYPVSRLLSQDKVPVTVLWAP